jgi:hypothetical protein
VSYHLFGSLLVTPDSLARLSCSVLLANALTAPPFGRLHAYPSTLAATLDGILAAGLPGVGPAVWNSSWISRLRFALTRH